MNATAIRASVGRFRSGFGVPSRDGTGDLWEGGAGETHRWRIGWIALGVEGGGGGGERLTILRDDLALVAVGRS